MESRIKKIIKRIIFPLLIFIVIILVILKFSELKKIGKLFKEANWFFVLIALVAQFLNYLSLALVYQKILEIFNQTIKLWRLIKTSLVILFLNQAVPSFAFFGNIFFLNLLKKQGIKEGKGVLIIILEFICYYFAFILMLLFGYGYLFIHRKITKIEIWGLGSFIVLLIFIGIMIQFWLRNKKRSKERIKWFFKKFNLFGGRNWTNEEKIEKFLEEIYQGEEKIKKERKKVIASVFWEIMKFSFDCLTVYFIFWAFNFKAQLGIVVVGYALAKLFAIVSFIPGGIGVFEGGMVLFYNSLAIPLEVAISVMLVFRALSFWLPIPLGIFLYRHLQNKEY